MAGFSDWFSINIKIEQVKNGYIVDTQDGKFVFINEQSVFKFLSKVFKGDK
jgi:hypothetical protein